VQASTTNVAELGISKLGATQKIAEPAKQAMSIKLWRQPQATTRIQVGARESGRKPPLTGAVARFTG